MKIPNYRTKIAKEKGWSCETNQELKF